MGGVFTIGKVAEDMGIEILEGNGTKYMLTRLEKWKDSHRGFIIEQIMFVPYKGSINSIVIYYKEDLENERQDKETKQ